MAMTEQELQTEVLRLAEKHGVLAHHCNSAYHCTGSGFPDLLLAGKYGYLIVELKTLSGTLRPAQVTWKHTLLAGGAAYRVWTPRELHSGLIESVLESLAYPEAKAA